MISPITFDTVLPEEFDAIAFRSRKLILLLYQCSKIDHYQMMYTFCIWHTNALGQPLPCTPTVSPLWSRPAFRLRNYILHTHVLGLIACRACPKNPLWHVLCICLGFECYVSVLKINHKSYTRRGTPFILNTHMPRDRRFQCMPNFLPLWPWRWPHICV